MTIPGIVPVSPLLGRFFGIPVYFYGFLYALGFSVITLWILWYRSWLNWTLREALDCSLLFVVCTGLGGRLYDVFVYEPDYFLSQPFRILEVWKGGFASHGLLLGALCSVLIFSYLHDKSWLDVADLLVVPGALFLGLGRLGNHVNGEVFGTITEFSIGMEFPYAEGMRHPVALYAMLKNLVTAAVLGLEWSREQWSRGYLFSHFLIFYGGLRVFVDLFRKYDVFTLGIPNGQWSNLVTMFGGILAYLIVRNERFGVAFSGAENETRTREKEHRLNVLRALLLIFFIGLSLTWPSGWSKHWLQANFG